MAKVKQVSDKETKEPITPRLYSGLDIPEEARSQTAGSEPYSHDEAVNSSARSGLGGKSKPTMDSQLGGGRSIVPELKDRNRL